MLREEKRLRILLTEDDYEAIDESDSDYLNSKGESYYRRGEYEKARAYFELSTTLGDTNAPTNLGYMYLYGKDTTVDYTVALAFYKIGARRGSIDAYYKLGNMYQSGKGVLKDNEKALSFYDKALDLLERENKGDPADYPSLFFTLGREHMPNGIKEENLGRAYDYLLIAEEGYMKQKEEYGAKIYDNILEETRILMKDEVFDKIKEQVPKAPVYELYDKEYKVKGKEYTGTLVKTYYSYEFEENIYIIEDKKHLLHDVKESELAEVVHE